MKREILVSATDHESWVAIVEDGRLAQVMLDRPDRDRIAGHVFKGRVDAVVPGIQAAFVDIGLEKAAFLQARDLVENDDSDAAEERDAIEERLGRGDWIVVQVTKESIGGKGPKVTAEISLAGRFLVYLPFSGRVGVSRKIEGRRQRHSLRRMAAAVVGDTGENGGVIVRTVGEEVTPQRMAQEFAGLRRTWRRIEAKIDALETPGVVHKEARLIGGVIRDLFTDSFEAVRVEPETVYAQVRDYVAEVAPDLVDRIHLHDGASGSLLEEAGVLDQLHRAFEPRVELKSGGHLVVESTEALVAIDVNTGRYTGSGTDAAKTILRTNLEAAREIAHQLRLRDVGGLVVIDFIDMEEAEHRQKVLHELRTHLGRDRARTRTNEISQFGLLEMTRQRVRPPLLERVTIGCRSCEGSGRVYSPATVARRVERGIRRAAADGNAKRIVIGLHPEVALHLLEEESGLMPLLRRGTGLELELRDDPVLREDEVRILAGPAEADVTGKYL